MESLFDEVSRILAEPRARRATLRIVLGTAAGAALAAFPGRSYAWAPIPCGQKSCFPDQGQMCCDQTQSLCCQQGTCLSASLGTKICCPVGKACGADLCCAGPNEACCTLCSGKSVCCN